MKIINKLTGEEFSEKSAEAAFSGAKDDPLIIILKLLSDAMNEPNMMIDWEGSEYFSSGDRLAAVRMTTQIISDLRLKHLAVHMTSETLEPANRIRVVYKLFRKEISAGQWVDLRREPVLLDGERVESFTKKKPCPFCGSEQVIIYRSMSYRSAMFVPGCVDCGCEVKGENGGSRSEEGAVEKWNRRAN